MESMVASLSDLTGIGEVIAVLVIVVGTVAIMGICYVISVLAADHMELSHDADSGKEMHPVGNIVPKHSSGHAVR